MVQVVTEYKESELDLVLGALERMTQNLTAAVVSNDTLFQQKVRVSNLNSDRLMVLRIEPKFRL